MKSLRIVALALSVALLGACEGDNLFEGGTGGGGAELSIDLTGPATGTKGDSVNVNVLATAVAGMQWVRITTTGAAAQWPTDTVITTSGTVFQGVLRIPTLVGGPDTLVVRGRVRDTQNREAGPDSVLVRLF